MVTVYSNPSVTFPVGARQSVGGAARFQPPREEAKPQMSLSVPIQTHVEADLHEEIVRLAALNDRSVSGEVRVAMRRHIEAEREFRASGRVHETEGVARAA